MATGGQGSRFKATAHVTCSLSCFPSPLFFLTSEPISGPHVLGTAGQGLLIMRREPPIAAVLMGVRVDCGLRPQGGLESGREHGRGPAGSCG